MHVMQSHHSSFCYFALRILLQGHWLLLTTLLFYFGFSKSVAWSLWWLYVFSRLYAKKKNTHTKILLNVAQVSAARTPWSQQLCTFITSVSGTNIHIGWIELLYFNLLLLMCCWHIGSVYATWVRLVQWKCWVNPLILWCQDNLQKMPAVQFYSR